MLLSLTIHDLSRIPSRAPQGKTDSVTGEQMATVGMDINCKWRPPLSVDHHSFHPQLSRRTLNLKPQGYFHTRSLTWAEPPSAQGHNLENKPPQRPIPVPHPGIPPSSPHKGIPSPVQPDLPGPHSRDPLHSYPRSQGSPSLSTPTPYLPILGRSPLTTPLTASRALQAPAKTPTPLRLSHACAATRRSLRQRHL